MERTGPSPAIWKILRYIHENRGFSRDDTEVSFLAAGEYNENYLIRSENERYVFRINRGSQLGLDEQIRYEFSVLKAVEPSEVTPRAYWCDPSPEGLSGGVLLMEFLPGSPLSYAGEGRLAASVFSRVHSVSWEGDDDWAPRLLRQPKPITEIAAESLGLIKRFPDHPLIKERDQLLRYHEKIRRLAEDREKEFVQGRQCIVNTEVNSNNFLVDGGAARLIDWEKAVISTPFQDLGHFLVETSTRWKSDYVFSPGEKRDFLKIYREESNTGMDLGGLVEMTAIMERTILLRALSWCFMAWYEYNRSGRALRNRDTENKIAEYLKEIEWFLR